MGPSEIEPRSYHLIRKTVLLNMTLFPSKQSGNPRPMTRCRNSHDVKPQKHGYKNLTSHKSLNYFVLLSHRLFIQPKNTAVCYFLINQ
jgi:hypothetical protein